ncbi:DUF4817 domain-containing protein [Trichonephila clavipes]|nr:DUF4817 domain-containing protein [Trichonephila clavipes]
MNLLCDFQAQLLKGGGEISSDPIGLTWEHDILVLKPSPCLHNETLYDWMGLDEWNSWFKSQVRDSNRSQENISTPDGRTSSLGRMSSATLPLSHQADNIYNLRKLTVWCTLWAGGIIGPYFFKNDEGHNVTVNGDRYRAMITNFFIPELNNHDVQELWFQQDGATYHTARATIYLLKETFGDSLISRFGPVNWPPRSCDLTPLDYFLWGYVKSLVYADK